MLRSPTVPLDVLLIQLEANDAVHVSSLSQSKQDIVAVIVVY